MSVLLALAMAAALASPSPATQTLPAADIQREVETVLAQRLRDAGSSARIVAIAGVRDQSLPGGRAKAEVGTIPGRWPRARAGVPVRLTVDGRAVRTLTAWVETTDVRRVLTYADAAHPRTAGDALRLVAGDVDMTCCDGLPVADGDALRGLRLRRAVRAGAPVLPSDFEPMPDVAERQQVTIEVVRGPVRLTTVGTALADGRIGQTIAVRPDASDSAVLARVTDKKKVSLDE
jgi:flagella basal body P-ring formation protein FlgA